MPFCLQTTARSCTLSSSADEMKPGAYPQNRTLCHARGIACDREAHAAGGPTDHLTAIVAQFATVNSVIQRNQHLYRVRHSSRVTCDCAPDIEPAFGRSARAGGHSKRHSIALSECVHGRYARDRFQSQNRWIEMQK
jgi:hypothetical protein